MVTTVENVAPYSSTAPISTMLSVRILRPVVSKSRNTTTVSCTATSRMQKYTAWYKQWLPPRLNGSATRFPDSASTIGDVHVIEQRLPDLVTPQHCTPSMHRAMGRTDTIPDVSCPALTTSESIWEHPAAQGSSWEPRACLERLPADGLEVSMCSHALPTAYTACDLGMMQTSMYAHIPKTKLNPKL